ncbi:hypothetical protein BLOT_009219 [Blomia tropicalis]|nr:hypothetical protein BLOT_009219 [Blomia tropicalis]
MNAFLYTFVDHCFHLNGIVLSLDEESSHLNIEIDGLHNDSFGSPSKCCQPTNDLYIWTNSFRVSNS